MNISIDGRTLDQIEKMVIQHNMKVLPTKVAVARALGISERSLFDKLKLYASQDEQVRNDALEAETNRLKREKYLRGDVKSTPVTTDPLLLKRESEA